MGEGRSEMGDSQILYTNKYINYTEYNTQCTIWHNNLDF